MVVNLECGLLGSTSDACSQDKVDQPLKKSWITALAIGIGLSFVWAIFVNGQRQTATPNTDSAPAASSTVTTTGEVTTLLSSGQDAKAPSPTASPALPATSAAPVRDAASDGAAGHTIDFEPTPIDGLRVVPAKEALASTLGSTDPQSGYALEVRLTGWGAAVGHIRLAQYTKTVLGEEPFEIQSALEYTNHDGESVTVRIYPFAARAVTVNGQRVELETQRWGLVEPGVYRISLADGSGREVLRITRSYSIKQDQLKYDLRCDQQIENVSDGPLRVVWEQYAQGDVPADNVKYMGDRRTLVAGYYNLEYNPTRQFVYTDDAYLNRQKVLDGDPFWTGNDSLPTQRELVWVASLDRYFATTVYRPAEPNTAAAKAVAPTLDSLFPKLDIQVIGRTGADAKHDGRKMAFTLTSRALDLAPGGHARLDLAMYAGPRKNEVFATEPYQSMGFAKLIVYELGCTMFTFQPLAKGLLGFLKLIHTVLRDWGVAIIFLVLCVRLVLHPITKKGQVNMFKMSKQMQTLQPEIEKLKKKYKNDQQKFQQEQLKLWREKGVNPFNMLGCLPMFLQMPIWVALYATLYLAIELRHQPAFYGIFQAISGEKWRFLADLSSPDNFIQFGGQGYTLNLLFVHPTFAGINLLPLLMAVVFYFQQKYTTPPPANEQAAQQQKIMKFMVLLFPIMLYSAPSGLTLYILASTAAGVIDSYIVRKHVKEQEEAGKLFVKKAPPKPGGFMDRMHKALETKQQQLMESKQRQSKRSGKNRKK